MSGDIASFNDRTSQVIDQNTPGVREARQAGDHFGGTVDNILVTGTPQSILNRDDLGITDYRLDGLPEYQSKPDAPFHILLDFDGVWTTTGYDDDGTNAPVFDLDEATASYPTGARNYTPNVADCKDDRDSPASGVRQFDHEVSFNRTEREIMEDIWAHVAEDYMPFNINVTTVIPDAPFDNVLRISMGGFWQDRNQCKSGSGIAYANIEDAWIGNAKKTVYVFTDTIERNTAAGFSDTAAKIGTTASHEAGHGLNTTHKGDFRPNGTKIREYSNGGGTWTPIMGRNLNLDRTIWTQSTYVLANGTRVRGRDDIAQITERIDGVTDGNGLRADDHTDRVDRGRIIGRLSAGSEAVATGVIEDTNDQDFFKVEVREPGLLRIAVLANDVGANLDSTLTYGRVGNTQTIRPAGTIDSAIPLWVQPGEYIIGVGSQAEFTGDVGQYSVRVGLHAGVEAAPVMSEEKTAMASATATAPRNSMFVGDPIDVTVGVLEPIFWAGTTPASGFLRGTTQPTKETLTSAWPMPTSRLSFGSLSKPLTAPTTEWSPTAKSEAPALMISIDSASAEPKLWQVDSLFTMFDLLAIQF